MKRFCILTTLFLGLQSVVAQNDSLNVVLQEAHVTASRATASTPIAFTNINAEQLQRSNHGSDLPYLVHTTPSCVATSDAGLGVGYTSLRIRGIDATRTNVMLNDIPLNDAESHSMFWVNMPDLASTLSSIQLQRGVGTSSNGSGAFGSNLNLQTMRNARQPYANINGSYGSFNTHKATFSVGSGLINQRFAFDARISDIGSDGYIDRASTRLKSFYTQSAFYGENTTARLLVFGGKERTYHAWNYASREEMEQFGRRYNSCGLMFTDENGHQHFYEDQTDNYEMLNIHALINHRLSEKWQFDFGLHYTKGDGYYQEYKDNRKLIEYGLQPFFDQQGSEVKKTDLIRKKSHDSHFGGTVFALKYHHKRLKATLGGGVNYYDNRHLGHVLWVKNYLGTLEPNKEYYNNVGRKFDSNGYIKGEYALSKSITAYADLQFRHTRYRISGTHDKYDSHNQSGMQLLNVDDTFNFLNPKFGLNWQVSKPLRLFASVGMAHKEPTRNHYTDGYFTISPKEESLIDYELGINFEQPFWHIGANLYYMDYKDQLVLTGELNEIGEAVSMNVPRSYRAGIELQFGLNTSFGLRWDVNTTLSRNRIKNFEETLYGYDDNWNDLPAEVIKHGDTHLSFSPEVIVNNALTYENKGFFARLTTQHVGKQYMSNADVAAHQLDAYTVSNLDLAYTFRPKSALKSITLGATLYNMFDASYENNGWASSNYLNTPSQRVNYTGYAAQAGRHVMAHLSLSF